MPTEVLSLVGAALPGQPVVTLSPLVSGATVLSSAAGTDRERERPAGRAFTVKGNVSLPVAGVASVTLNFPGLANQLQLPSQPHPPVEKVFTGSAPFSIRNLPGN